MLARGSPAGNRRGGRAPGCSSRPTSRALPRALCAPPRRAIAIEAAEQCRRLTVPAVAPVRSLPELIADWPADRRLFVCDPTAELPVASAAAAARSRGPDGAWAVLVGPEGGWAAGELDG